MTNASTAAKAAATNYTAAQEAIIREEMAKGPGGKGTLEIAKALGGDPDKGLSGDPRMVNSDGQDRGYRSIVAKVNRMALPYARKEPTAKDGSPVTKKTDLVERIAAIVTGNLDGLEKAPKPALVAIAAYLEAATASDDAETVNG
jgi:hypothetical protein